MILSKNETVNSKKIWIFRIAGILGIFAVCFAFFFMGQKLFAANLQNTYVLSVSTGADGTDLKKFQYIAIHYTDTSNTDRTYYILADLAEERSRTISGSTYVDADIRKSITSVMDYTLTNSSKALFDSYSQGMLYFKPDYDVKLITGVDFLTKTSDSWTCEGLKIYRVDTIYGTKGVSYVSADTFEEFSGELVFKTTDSYINTLNWTDFQLLRFGSDSTCNVTASSVSEDYDNHLGSEYLLKIDLSDEYLAGLESLAAEYSDGKAGFTSLKEAELMTVRIEYLDTYGCHKSVTVPVISNVLGYAIDKKVKVDDSNPVLGLAGQGESLVFPIWLPDFKELYTTTDKSGNVTKQPAVYLTCGGKNLLTGTGLTVKADSKSAKRAAKASSDKDSVSIAGVSLYKASSTSAKIDISDGLLKVTLNGSPLYYHVSSNSTGDAITYAGTETSLSMAKYETGDSLTLNKNYDDQYLIELQTDRASLAGTVDNLTVELSYMDLNGVSRVTDGYDVRELMNVYYGYWPSSGSDFAYLKGASSGGVLRFVISLANVDYFTGIRVSIDGSDEWQMSGMTIYKLYGLSNRVGTFEDSSVGSTSSHVSFSRDYEGVKAYSADSMDMLVEKGSSKEFGFTSDSMVEIEKYDWSSKQYALSYEEALNDLGFTDGKYVYTVEVNVASDAKATYSDGDSGSKNQFFFRLQFENGSSPYVLANQQMTSDGFRAGQTETFTITMNEDYGDVTAVHIIPEMKNSEDYVYDKLNVDSIKIIQNSSSATSKSWTVSSVGWIGTEYADPGEENGLRSTKSIYEAELAKIYPVDYTSSMTNLLFCLTTGSYLDKEGKPVEQFQGKVDVTLQYISTTGESKTATFDIVKYMYSYMDKTPINDESGLSGGALSDPTYMFRAQHTDRFILPVSDIKMLTRVDFYPTSTNGTSWQISNLSVSGISNLGTRYVSDTDEIMYTGKTTFYCSNSEEINLMVCPKNTRQEGVKVNMTPYIFTNSDSSKWVSVVTREPISTKDTLNVFVHMRDGADDKSTFDLKVTAEYTNVSGLTVRSSERVMSKDTSSSENIFYLQGLDVKELSVLNNLIIETSSDKLCYAPIDYAMVQRVRSGVIIDTYYLYYAGADPGTSNTSVKASPSTTGQSTGEYQVVTLGFGGSTKNMQLIAENRDLAVAIKYISNAGNNGNEYSSTYIFLTDQEINSIYSGQSVDIVFHEKYVKEITGIVLVPSGQVEADLTGALVATYQDTSEDAKTAQNVAPLCFYSFPGTYHIAINQASNVGAVTITDPVVTTSESTDVANVVLPVTMTIKTAAAAKDYESGTNTPIRMKLYYTDASGASQVYTVNDITKVATSGSSFATDGTATLKFMLTGVKSLTSVTFEPYDTDASNIAGWTPEKLTIETKTVKGTNTISREINTRLYEGMAEESRITLSNVVLAATVVVTNADASKYSSYNTLNGDVNVLVENDQYLRVFTSLTGSSLGFSYRLERVSSDNSALVAVALNSDNGASIDSNGYLTLTANTLAKQSGAGSYQLTVYTNENSKLNTIVKFTVEGENVTAESAKDVSSGN